MPIDSAKAETCPAASTPAGRTFPASLFPFLVATFALTWACWFGVLAARIPLQSPIAELLVLVGTFAPAFAALWLTGKYEGRRGIHSLLNRTLKWRVGIGWYVLAVTYTVAVKLASALIYRLIAGAWPRFGTVPWYVMFVAIVFSTPVQSGEELGWRGYVLPRLAERMGFAWASVVLGLIWAGWHLPIFFIPGADKYHQSFPLWATAVTAVSVAMAYMYVKTGGSLLLTMLMHAAVNNTSDIVPAAQGGSSSPFTFHASPILWLTTALMWIVGAYLLLGMPRTTGKSEPVSNNTFSDN